MKKLHFPDIFTAGICRFNRKYISRIYRSDCRTIKNKISLELRIRAYMSFVLEKKLNLKIRLKD